VLAGLLAPFFLKERERPVGFDFESLGVGPCLHFLLVLSQTAVLGRSNAESGISERHGTVRVGFLSGFLFSLDDMSPLFEEALQCKRPLSFFEGSTDPVVILHSFGRQGREHN